MSESKIQRALDLVEESGIVRPRDLTEQGIPGGYLHRLHERGEVEKVGRGLYREPDAKVTEHHSLVETAKAVPAAVVCLLSALRFHGLTTQSPFEVWVAIEQSAWRPTNPPVPLRISYLSGDAYTQGIEEREIEGVEVKIYGPAKTVADCFKFRNKVGQDVALEALRDFRERYPAEMDELWRFAKINRVSRVMRPYLEVLA